MSAANPSPSSAPPRSSATPQSEAPASAGSQQPRSYAHATRHSISSAAVVSGSPQNAKAASVNTTQAASNMAAPPVAGTPSNGSSGPGHEHSRKPSVTISAAGSSGQMPNGAPPASTARPNINFGAMNQNGQPPAVANSSSYHQPSSSLSAAPVDPRVNSPAASPSPIPQPSVSGGRPLDRVQSQNNGLTFGMHGSQEGGPSVPSPSPGMQAPNAHFRRASSQSQHSDLQGGMPISPGVGRGGYMNGSQRGGRGGYAYGPMNSPRQPYANMQTPPRNGPNMPHHFQNPMGPGSPAGPPRSPAPMGSQPGTPMQSHMQMHGQPVVYPGYPGYQQQMAGQNHQFHQQPEYAQQYNYYGQPYQVPPAYMQGPPHTPRTPGFKNQPPMPHQQYGHGQFNQPPSQNMSRTSSQMSERPASSIGSAQPHSSAPGGTSQVSHGHSQSTSAAGQGASIKIPSRQSKAIVIKNSEGEVVTFDKKSASPAPPPTKEPSPAPAPASVPASTPSPVPQAPAAASHSRTESKSGKSAAEIRQEFMNSVKKEQEKDSSPLKEEPTSADKPTVSDEPSKVAQVSQPTEAKTVETPAQPTDPASISEPKGTSDKQEAKVPATSDDKAGKAQETEEQRKKREDEELEAMIAEMEAKDKEEEAKEKAFQEKRKEEDAARKAREAQNAAMDDEKMRQAEREAEAREEAREKGKSNEQEDADQAESQKLFASLKKPTLGPGAEEQAESESRASTPATSDRDSMPPPARAAKASGLSRAKPAPAALKLETAKSVEPAQPTPGMRSLRSARMLQLQSESVTYPEGVQSPNPALNQSGRRGGRLYDTGFLMQFQEAFKEKPSLDWDEKVKETLGDGNDAPKSARPPQTPGGRGGGRTPSQNFPPAGMGTFGAGPGGRRPGGPMGFDPAKMGNPIGQFGAGRPPFPGPGMGRAPSQAANQMHASQRGSSNRGSKAGSKMTLKQQEQANSKMPLTAGADLKPLEQSGSGWKPMSLAKTPAAAAADTSGHMQPDMVQRKVKASLNKMTPERFDKIAEQIMVIAAQSRAESDGRTLRQIIALTFEKACDEAHWAEMYARFCQHMLQEMSIEIMDENVRDKAGNPVVGGALFRKYLLNRCQEEFERGWVVNLPENPEGQQDEAAMLSDEYYKAAAAKRKGLGLVQFIGELYKLRMLSIKIMHQCVTKLLDFEGEPDEASIESLCKLLKTVGGPMESEGEGQRLTKIYFERINKIMTDYKLPSRLHFMLLDVVDLKNSGWRDKNAQKGPKTIQEIREEALAAQQKAEAERARQSNQRRMPSGRQDSRGFPNPPPPQDYSRNSVGSDDLRKLSQKRESRQNLGPGKTLGPSTMLGSRSSSGRQGFGPPTGLMSRSESQAGSSPGGSGMHSRTASIKADPKKDEEAKTSANAFSALAGMDGDEASSPPLTKSQPATEGNKAD